MQNYITGTYSEFLDFMNIPPQLMPEIHLIENKDEINKNVIAFVNNDEIKFPVTNLYYNPDLLVASDDYKKAKLFHEFTHILDYIVLHERFSTDQLNSILATYSEYHASQIELLRNIGVGNIKDIKTIDKLDVDETYVWCKESKISLTEDYLSPLADSSVVIGRSRYYYYTTKAVEYFSKYKEFEAKTMYYLGKQSVCFMLSQKIIADITDKTYGEFSSCIRKIEKCIKNKEFDVLKEVRNELWNKYTSTFPCLYGNHLPKVL